MRVELQNDRSGETFSNQLIDLGNGEFPLDLAALPFLKIFVSLLNQKLNSFKRFSQTLFKITEIIFG